MKTLEFKEMENLQGGQYEIDPCAAAIGLSALVLIAGGLTGGLGWLIGGAGAVAMLEEGC